MAVKKCPKCAEKIQREAVVCRYCGADQPALPMTSSKATWVIVTVVGVLLLAVCSRGNDTTTTAPRSTDAVGGSAPALSGDGLPAAPPSPWLYRSSKDDVRGQDVHTAGTTSSNEVNFDFPYSGGSTLSVTARKHPEYGTDVYFEVSKGQMLCNSYRGCYATVRFDDKAPVRVSLNESSDNSSEIVFVQGAESFIKKMKAAKKMVVELEFYQAGRPQFTFNIEGLVWPPKAASETPTKALAET